MLFSSVGWRGHCDGRWYRCCVREPKNRRLLSLYLPFITSLIRCCWPKTAATNLLRKSLVHCIGHLQFDRMFAQQLCHLDFATNLLSKPISLHCCQGCSYVRDLSADFVQRRNAGADIGSTRVVCGIWGTAVAFLGWVFGKPLPNSAATVASSGSALSQGVGALELGFRKSTRKGSPQMQ